MSARAQIIIDQGESFFTTLTVNFANGSPIDLTSYEVESQMRKDYSSISSTPFVASGNSSGVISLFLDANTSLSMDYGRYVYDVVMKDPLGNISRVVEGQVTLVPAVTRIV